MKGYDEALRRIEEAAEKQAVGLELSYLELETLPASIGKLVHLENLSIYGNRLKELPPEIGKLINLIRLYVGEKELTELPPEIGNLHNLKWLYLSHNRLSTLPPEIGQLEKLEMLDLPNNQFVTLPDELSKLTNLRSINLSDNHLKVIPSLPTPLSESNIDLELDRNPLEEWGEKGLSHVKLLSLRDCPALTYLPDWLQQVHTLVVDNCHSLKHLPEHLVVTGKIYLANTALKSLPEGCKQAQLYWGRIPIDYQIAFHAETITAEEVLNERNVERRRLILEQMGYERFIEQTKPQILDDDTDTGGVRQLLRIWMRDDEPLVLLRVHDPSTERQYLLRVPPNMRTCHQAAAWIAGFDNPDDYRPIMET